MKVVDNADPLPFKKYSEERPWGKFERFTNNQPSTVKIISVNPVQELSLQWHHKREEFWRVIFGWGKVIIGEQEQEANEGDEFFIKKGQVHRLVSGDLGIKVLEIAFGDFSEDDIVRIDDKYDRK